MFDKNCHEYFLFKVWMIKRVIIHGFIVIYSLQNISLSLAFVFISRAGLRKKYRPIRTQTKKSMKHKIHISNKSNSSEVVSS